MPGERDKPVCAGVVRVTPGYMARFIAAVDLRAQRAGPGAMRGGYAPGKRMHDRKQALLFCKKAAKNFG